MTATDPIPTVVAQRKILAQACETLPTYNPDDILTRCYSLWTDGKISSSDSTMRYDEKTHLFRTLYIGHEESRPYAPPGLHWAHTHIVLGNNPSDSMVHLETTDEAIRRIGALPKNQRQEAIQCSAQDAYVTALLRRAPVYAALLESMARKMTLSAILGDPSLPPASES